MYLSIKDFQSAFRQSGFRCPIVLISESAADRYGIKEDLLHSVEQKAMVWVSRIDANPTPDTVLAALQALHAGKNDGVIAIGGGSAIDLAKTVSAFRGLALSSYDEVVACIDRKAYGNNRANALPILAVPTTSGTGSEVTQWATIWDYQNNKKYSVDAHWLRPAATWYVPELMLTQPVGQTLSTGLDAVCHAVEGYWSQKSDPLVRELAVSSVRLFVAHLRPTLDNPTSLPLREKLCTASALAGLAFSTTRTTACHSISYPLTYLHGINHGFAVAMTLAEVANYNRRKVDLSPLLLEFEPYGGMCAWLDGVCDGIVKLRLSGFGVSTSALDRIVEGAFTGGRMDNNPVDLTTRDVYDILTRVL